jgi:hypothetical protein
VPSAPAHPTCSAPAPPPTLSGGGLEEEAGWGRDEIRGHGRCGRRRGGRPKVLIADGADRPCGGGGGHGLRLRGREIS